MGFLVLKHIGAPEGFLNAMQGLYSNAGAHVQADGKLQFMFTVASGVITGCPMSGALFNLQ